MKDKLDEKNKVIFENLLSNGRCSVKDLSRLLKISKASIIKRLKYLEENEFISRYDAIINWQKLPFIKKVYFVKTSFDNFEKIIRDEKNVFSLMSLSGLCNYQIWCFFKNNKQKNDFEKKLNKFDYEEIEVNELIFPKISFFDVKSKLSLPSKKEKEIKLNIIDVKLMKYMAEGHGRDSLFEISQKLNLPYDSVHYHGKKLFESGYFEAFIAQPGTSKFTIQTTCLLIKCTDKKSCEKLYKLLGKTPKIISNAIGNENKILVHFLSQTHLEYRETLSKIFSLIKKEKINSLVISHWDKIILNNRYPLEFLLE